MHNIIWILSNLAQHYLQTVRLQNCTSRVNDSAELHLQSAWLGAAESRECLTLHNCPTEYEIAQLHLQTTEDCRATPVECNNLHSCTSRECNTAQLHQQIKTQPHLQSTRYCTGTSAECKTLHRCTCWVQDYIAAPVGFKTT